MEARCLQLVTHVLAMADDAYFEGHPEWQFIVDDAKEAMKATKAGDSIPNHLVIRQLCDDADMVNERWDHTGTNMLEGYPECLPSWDEFVGQLNHWYGEQRAKFYRERGK